MIDLDSFSNHLKTLTKNDWYKLFSLLPDIEVANSHSDLKGFERHTAGTMSFTNWESSQLVNKVVNTICTLQLAPIFDWSAWEDGKKILLQQEYDYASLDTITLCKLLTVIIRADRFNEGYLISCFENGIITKIIKALKKNIYLPKKPELRLLTQSLLFGVAVGDALGVPVEFMDREALKFEPVTDMTGYGTYNLPPGTWSDDSSLTFCLAEALTHGFDLNEIGRNFVRWYRENFWTPHGEVFDIGITTRQAILKIMEGESPEMAGGRNEHDNGNGSLMRISPLLFYLPDKPVQERYHITEKVSSITHGHVRSVISCFYYLEFARLLLEGNDKFDIYHQLKTFIHEHLVALEIPAREIEKFDRILRGDIFTLEEYEIQSSGYVLHTLEASVWCLMTTDSYRDAVLKAVNLGDDTDTTGAVTGGLAGLLYGFESIPKAWIRQLAKKEEIEGLAIRLADRISDSV